MMSYFLWIEDFENNVKATTADVFGSISLGLNQISDEIDKLELKKYLEEKGVFLELSFQDGLDFIQNKLQKVDYIILDIDLVPYIEDDPLKENVLSLLEKFFDYQVADVLTEDEKRQLLKKQLAELKKIAGYCLYTELLVEQSFPKQHILFCSNHGDTTNEIQKAFKAAKIELPPIYEKSNKKIQEWVRCCYESDYSRLRRGIIQGCQYAKEFDSSKLYFNKFTTANEPTEFKDLISYLEILETFLPLQEPKNKQDLYKLFVRTLSHEWEGAKSIKRDKEKNDAVLAWIMRNTRHWITHNSNLFAEINEKLVAYLFMINMRVMFNYGNGNLQDYEKVLLSLFEKEALSENDFKYKTIPVSEAYLTLKNIVLDENHKKDIKIEDAFYFNELANNIQLSNSPVRNDKKLFIKLLYQMFWLCTSNPFISTGNRKSLLEIKFYDFKYEDTPYMFELARHIYYCSFPPE
jgi:hypothetical protein